MQTGLLEVLEEEKRQRQHLKTPESKFDPPMLEKLHCFVSEQGSVVQRRMIDLVLSEIGDKRKPLSSDLALLIVKKCPPPTNLAERDYTRAGVSCAAP